MEEEEGLSWVDILPPGMEERMYIAHDNYRYALWKRRRSEALKYLRMLDEIILQAEGKVRRELAKLRYEAKMRREKRRKKGDDTEK